MTQLTFSLEEPPANPSQSQACGKEWMTHVVTWHSSIAEFLTTLDPQWFVWENVPGVLSSGGGRDFGSFLGAVAQLGYGFSYRVLDAQYCGVAQRRRRIFVVGHLGDWRPAAAVLFERFSLRRDLAPSAPQGKEPSAYFESSLAQYKQGDIGGTLKASGGVLGGGSETFLVQKVMDKPAHKSYNLAVRRLTPKECERLQGFPDNFTNVPWRKKDTSPEGLRYKALGNSMAVPCMSWLGKRIQMVEDNRVIVCAKSIF